MAIHPLSSGSLSLSAPLSLSPSLSLSLSPLSLPPSLSLSPAPFPCLSPSNLLVYLFSSSPVLKTPLSSLVIAEHHCGLEVSVQTITNKHWEQPSHFCRHYICPAIAIPVRVSGLLLDRNCRVTVQFDWLL